MKKQGLVVDAPDEFLHSKRLPASSVRYLLVKHGLAQKYPRYPKVKFRNGKLTFLQTGAQGILNKHESANWELASALSKIKVDLFDRSKVNFKDGLKFELQKDHYRFSVTYAGQEVAKFNVKFTPAHSIGKSGTLRSEVNSSDIYFGRVFPEAIRHAIQLAHFAALNALCEKHDPSYLTYKDNFINLNDLHGAIIRQANAIGVNPHTFLSEKREEIKRQLD